VLGKREWVGLATLNQPPRPIIQFGEPHLHSAGARNRQDHETRRTAIDDSGLAASRPRCCRRPTSQGPSTFALSDLRSCSPRAFATKECCWLSHDYSPERPVPSSRRRLDGNTCNPDVADRGACGRGAQLQDVRARFIADDTWPTEAAGTRVEARMKAENRGTRQVMAPSWALNAKTERRAAHERSGDTLPRLGRREALKWNYAKSRKGYSAVDRSLPLRRADDMCLHVRPIRGRNLPSDRSRSPCDHTRFIGDREVLLEAGAVQTEPPPPTTLVPAGQNARATAVSG
jgi:hypothetical protein